ncbi:MAG: alpha-L-fucosidase [Clostridia bacterium]|nr:alpha-L-fucosidase [Clostridia bacterium]
MEKGKRFWGLHFDFHAKNTDEIGIRTEAEDIERYLLAAKPDFIQCDSKGHEGNSSYPTKVGKQAALIKSDNLRVWRDVTKKHDVPLYVHYSGVWDAEYVDAHPDEGQRNKDGELTGRISLFGSYLDDCMIPQLKEFADDYGIDGAWIDGDCWAVQCDYSDRAKAVLGENLTPIEHNIAMRDAFFKYVQTYVDAIHKHAPHFKITSNWIYTPTSPDKPTVDVDFLSGDLSPQDSVHDVRFASRCTALRGKPWDLMAWGFEWTHFTDKPAVQLMQEAAGVLSLGGGFQVYITQNKDGSARRANVDRVAKIAEFVRAREMLFEKEPIAQVGALYSEYGYYHCREKGGCPFASGDTRIPLVGALNATLDAQYTLNVLCDYQADRFDEYNIMLVPEWDDIGDDMRRKLLAYAERGGKLVLLGAKACRSFGDMIGTKFGETVTIDEAYLLGDDGCFAAVNNALGKTKVSVDVLDLTSGEGTIYTNADLRDGILPSYRIDDYGKGKIAYVPYNFGYHYSLGRSYNVRNYLKKILMQLEAPVIEIDRTNIDLTMQECDDGLIVNLLNMQQGRHSLTYLVYDEVPEVYNVTVKVKGKFTGVTMPLGEKFTYELTDDGAVIKLERLDIHSIIVLKK